MTLDWGPSETNDRGQLILGSTSQLGLVVLNVGTTTFSRDRQRETVSAVSLALKIIEGAINDCEVIDDCNASDHLYITFSIGYPQHRTPSWIERSLNDPSKKTQSC